MASIRARLTTTYAAALTGTILVFGGTLWLGRGAVLERDVQRYATGEAEGVLRLAAEVRDRNAPGKPLPLTEYVDSLKGARVTPPLNAVLEALPDIVFLFDTAGFRVYASREVRLLSYGSVV